MPCDTILNIDCTAGCDAHHSFSAQIPCHYRS